ncbi:hypothetical protein MPTK1_6g07930 [Marchantia polymorpha subsp. ruderalis]|uniref:Uncharacterized protein n=2 Tax=Marchantia polymorpha TaxID=3197 RepID=A0A176W0L4_MARPO|nr:hypothetical protein AXG93_4542s1310 [Marchantia polymorpha subsp. ruderalis]PTQ38184.1 hypothetical protein MARPO_0053s0106 [Marchantia polymorpha]BBN13982.1 hypothetical protein Mp_6g07930 [Marchantia polymorpha subsp. ruderalis]|eukprot:PTQ38184.1 hypothetical protein MARPO_0053s0106 [Marchantia polymorpha]
MGKQQNRARKEPSPGKKVSDVEAAYVVQSYLIEKQFTKTLVDFRVDAASILNSLKNAPPAVRSLTTILNDFVTLREKQQALQEENSRLERCLKEAQQLMHQERSRMSSLVQGVYESLAAFQSGSGAHGTLALPSMSSTPTHTAAIMQAGHNTPPGAGMVASKSPGVVKEISSVSASNKRKTALNRTPQDSPSLDAPAAKAIATKKPRQTGQVSGPVQGGPPSPWMCGMVRKTSMHMVRPVVPILQQHEMCIPPLASKAQQSGRSVPSPRSNGPLANSQSKRPASSDGSLPTLQNDQQSLSSALPTVPCEESGPASADKDQACGQDPHTPPRNSTNTSCAEQLPIHLQSPEGSAHNPHVIMTLPTTYSCTPPSALEDQSPNHPREERSADVQLVSESSRQSTPDSIGSDSTREQFHFKKVPSRTMRPLHFSDSTPSAQIASPASQCSPPTMSPAPTECEDTSTGAQAEETSEHSATDLFLIDDILASLDDASFSSLVGDMLGTEEITMNDMVSNSQTYGDVDFSNIQNVTERPSVGEDSFGFQCLSDAGKCENATDPLVKGLVTQDDDVKYSGPSISTNATQCSSSRPLGILSARDANQTSLGSSPTKRGSANRPSSKREMKSKQAFGQENIPLQDLGQTLDVANSYIT